MSAMFTNASKFRQVPLASVILMHLSNLSACAFAGSDIGSRMKLSHKTSLKSSGHRLDFAKKISGYQAENLFLAVATTARRRAEAGTAAVR